jgi:hypothetical protein
MNSGNPLVLSGVALAIRSLSQGFIKPVAEAQPYAVFIT